MSKKGRKPQNMDGKPSDPTVIGYYSPIPEVKLLVLSKPQNNPMFDISSPTIKIYDNIQVIH